MNELMHNGRLLDLAREINQREEGLEEFREHIVGKLRASAAEILLQGQALLEAKALMRHGEWLDWLAANCPKVSPRSAARYMARAFRAEVANGTVSYLHDLLGNSEPKALEEGESRKWPGAVEWISRTARWATSIVERAKVDRWSEAERKREWEILEPVVKILRPDLFGEG